MAERTVPCRLMLGELIARLESEPREKRVKLGFGNPHSWRGIYSELAFEPVEDTTVGEMLDAARSALGATYEGWKGGQYTMSEYSDVHLDYEGESNGETLGALLLEYLLADEVPNA